MDFSNCMIFTCKFNSSLILYKTKVRFILAKICLYSYLYKIYQIKPLLSNYINQYNFISTKQQRKILLTHTLTRSPHFLSYFIVYLFISIFLIKRVVYFTSNHILVQFRICNFNHTYSHQFIKIFTHACIKM